MNAEGKRVDAAHVGANLAHVADLAREAREAVLAWDFKDARRIIAAVKTVVDAMPDLIEFVERDINMAAFDALNRARATADVAERRAILDEVVRKFRGQI